jgi:hypothetical protein
MRRFEEGMLLWACGGVSYDPREQTRELGQAQALAVRFSSAVHEYPSTMGWDATTRVLVTGRLRIGDVVDRRILEAWGDLEDATWTSLGIK